MPSAPKFRLSRFAAADLEAIANYTIEQFGIKQARRYRDGFERAFKMISDHPLSGRSAVQLVADMRRYEHESHIIFYRVAGFDILVVRVLHRRMNVERHAMMGD